MNRRRWTYVGVAAGAMGALFGARFIRKRRAANATAKPCPGMWDLTKDVAESIDAGKRALRGEEEEEAPKPPVD